MAPITKKNTSSFLFIPKHKHLKDNFFPQMLVVSLFGLGRILVTLSAKTTQSFSSKHHPGFVKNNTFFSISITNKLPTFFSASVSQLAASMSSKRTRKSLQLQQVLEIETENHQKVRLSLSLLFELF